MALFLERHCCPCISPLARRFSVLTEEAYQPQQVVLEPKLPPLPPVPSLPAVDFLAFETESTGQLKASFNEASFIDGALDYGSDRGVTIPGFVTNFLLCSILGPVSQNRQFA